jgi:hypothetical protein
MARGGRLQPLGPLRTGAIPLTPAVSPVTDVDLAEKVRWKVWAGLLPVDAPVRTWTRPGTGRRCAACDAWILRSQREREIERADGARHSLHIACHGMWVLARQWWGVSAAKARPATSSTPGAPGGRVRTIE